MAKISAGSGFHCGFGYLRDVFELVLLGAWAVAGDGVMVGLVQIDYLVLVRAQIVNVGLVRGLDAFRFLGLVYVVNKS